MSLETIVVDLVNNLVLKGETVILQTKTPVIDQAHLHGKHIDYCNQMMVDQWGPVRSFIYMSDGTFELSYDPMDYGRHASQNLPPSFHLKAIEVELLQLEKFGQAWYLTKLEQPVRSPRL